MLEKDPTKRITAKEALAHKYFAHGENEQGDDISEEGIAGEIEVNMNRFNDE